MRISEIPCPEHCAYSPFSIDTYDMFLSADESLNMKVMRYLAQYVTEREFMATASRLWPLRDIEEAEAEIVAQGLAAHMLFFVQKDAGGETPAERWEAASWRGLTNDERVMVRARRAAYPTVVEVQRVVDDQAMECIDTLAPGSEPFVVFDRATAARALRFDRMLAWVSRYPHYHRIGPAGVVVPRQVAEEFERELRARAGVGSGPEDTLPLRDYLKGHFGECCQLVTEVTNACRQRLVESMDAHHCVALYGFAAERAEIRKILADKIDFEPEGPEPDASDHPGTERYAWLRRGESASFEQQHATQGIQFDSFRDGVGVIGNVKLLPDGLEVETFTRAKYEFAKGLVERYFGDRLVLQSESSVDLAAKAAKAADSETETDDAREESEIPPDVEQALAEQFYARHYQEFLDKPVPALDGLTPRQAAAKAAMRPRLVELMKGHVHQIESTAVERGIYLDIDWVLEELGLVELLDYE